MLEGESFDFYKYVVAPERVTSENANSDIR